MKITKKQLNLLAESVILDSKKEDTIEDLVEKRLSIQEKRIQLLKEGYNLELIKEFNVQVSGPRIETDDITVEAGNVSIETNFGKWATYLGITKAVCATAVHIALISAGWEGVLAILIPVAIPVLTSPVIMGSIALFLSRYSFFRKIAGFLFKMLIGKKNYQRINNMIDNITNIMMSSTDNAIEKKDALTLFVQSAGYVLGQPEFRKKLKELAYAYMSRNKEKVKQIMSELDVMVRSFAPSQSSLTLDVKEDELTLPDNSPKHDDIENLEAELDKSELIQEKRKSKKKKVDYKKSYKKYHSSKKAKRERAQRNAAGRKIKNELGIEIPKGYEIDHKTAIAHGGSNDLSNLRIIPRSKNRALGQKITTRKRKKNGSYKKWNYL